MDVFKLGYAYSKDIGKSRGSLALIYKTGHGVVKIELDERALEFLGRDKFSAAINLKSASIVFE